MSRSQIPSIALFPKKVPDRRRQARVPVQIQVTVKAGHFGTALLTGDLNRGGLFIRTDDPRRLRQLVELEIDLHDGQEPINTLAVVRHRISATEAREYGRIPGMGIQFYGMSNQTRRRWESFTLKLTSEYQSFAGDDIVGGVGSTHQDTPKSKRRSRDVWASDTPMPPDQDTEIEVPPPDDPTEETVGANDLMMADPFEKDGDPGEDGDLDEENDPDVTPAGPVLRMAGEEVIDKIRRDEVRYEADFKVRMPTVEKLHEFMTRDISAGGIFLRTKRTVEIGTVVQVLVIHPETEQEFGLGGEVVRLHNDESGNPNGLGIKFTGLDDKTTADLRQFVVSGVPDDLLDVGDFLFDDDELDELM